MALDGDRLGTAIAATIQSFKPAPGTAITEAQLEQMWQAIGREIVKEFEDNAEITTTVAVTQVTGVTPGGGVSGPGTGTGTGTIT